MTFRAKPVSHKRRLTQREGDARQQLYVTIGFIALIILALAILAGAVAVTYYNDHWRSIARVEGADISIDQWNDRQKVEEYRLAEVDDRIRTAVSSGQLDSSTASQQLQLIQDAAGKIPERALDALIDARLQARLAQEAGIAVTDADVDAALAEEATIAEQRKVSVVAVQPEQDEGASSPTDAQRAAAKQKADAALADLKAGKAFDEVAKQYSTDASGQGGGSLGYITKSYSADPAFVEAVFALALNGTTEVIEGADGTFRVGQVTDIVPSRQDAGRNDRINQAVGLGTYREALRADVVRKRLQERVVADATSGESEQVHASEVFVAYTDTGETSTTPEVRASHILYSPKDDPQNAYTLDKDDPAWEAAKKEADAAVLKLQAETDPEKRAALFAELAKAESDDKSSGAQGGDLGWFSQATMVQEFSDAIFDKVHDKYEVIGPVKTQFGYHVILYVEQRKPPQERIKEIQGQLAAPGADFAAIAKASSDAADASKGGDMGWVARLQLEKLVEDVLFGLQAGQTSDIITRDDGFHIYRVAERQQRVPDAEQVTALQSSAFDNWYTPRRDQADIWRSPEALAAGTQVTTTP
jgi:parvulin-like peptidyl-prolyl isomerase